MPLIPNLIKNVNSICAYSMIQSKSLEGAAAKSAGGPVCYAGSIHKKEYKMKEKIYTIPVNDAFDKDCECPLCAMYQELEIMR